MSSVDYFIQDEVKEREEKKVHRSVSVFYTAIIVVGIFEVATPRSS